MTIGTGENEYYFFRVHLAKEGIFFDDDLCCFALNIIFTEFLHIKTWGLMNTLKNKKKWVSPELIGEGVKNTSSGTGIDAVEGMLPTTWPTTYEVYYAPLS